MTLKWGTQSGHIIAHTKRTYQEDIASKSIIRWKAAVDLSEQVQAKFVERFLQLNIVSYVIYRREVECVQAIIT